MSAASSSGPNQSQTDNSSLFPHSNTPPDATLDSSCATPIDPESKATLVSSVQDGSHSGGKTKEKQRCTYPDCNMVFKDLKAHMLTHQDRRPQKCPIKTCPYHTRGFARTYDRNRHTLGHFRGTLVCGFCPGPGTSTEKSFCRVDLFKRHLATVHGAERTQSSNNKPPMATLNNQKSHKVGNCSTCPGTFLNAQEFYRHLEDCVLQVLLREDPTEAINEQHLAEVANDSDVRQTLEKNVPTTIESAPMQEDEDEVEPNLSVWLRESTSRSVIPSQQRFKRTTRSRPRRNRRFYPRSWGFDNGQMTMKKRVLAMFNGPHRIAKDDMMLSTDSEIRIETFSDGRSYLTDLDMQTMKRTESVLSGAEEAKSPGTWDDAMEKQFDETQNMFEEG